MQFKDLYLKTLNIIQNPEKKLNVIILNINLFFQSSKEENEFKGRKLFLRMLFKPDYIDTSQSSLHLIVFFV